MEFTFSEKPTVDTLDDVPEAFRMVYVKGDDGKFSINPEMAGLTSALDGLNGALKRERGVSQTLRAQKDPAAQLKEIGFDSFEAAKARIDELQTAVAAKAQVDPAKIRAEIEHTFVERENTLNGQLKAMETTLTEHLIGNVAKSAISEHKGNALFLMPHIERAAKVVKDDASGQYVVRVVDADGQFRGDGKGGFMGVGDLVGEMKANKSFGGAFESDQQGGTGGSGRPGTSPSRGAQQAAANREGNDRSSTDKIAGGLSRLQSVGSLGAGTE